MHDELHFATLPLEIRQAIYSYLLIDPTIVVTGPGVNSLDVSSYRLPISTVSRQLRAESLPFFGSGKTILVCVLGHFPDSIRRRIPRRVFLDIGKIVILDDVAVDEIKPTPRTFPNLKTLEFDLVAARVYQVLGRKVPTIIKDDMLIRGGLARTLSQHYENLTMPREGLERDYLPENTLWDVVYSSGGRAKRGFNVIAMYRHWKDYDGGWRNPEGASVITWEVNGEV